MQLYTIVSGIYFEDAAYPEIPDSYARWVVLIDNGAKEPLGYGIWSWVCLERSTLSFSEYSNFLGGTLPTVVAPNNHTLNFFLFRLWLLVSLGCLGTLWIAVAFVLGLAARRKALVSRQLLWSRILWASYTFVFLLCLLPLIWEFLFLQAFVVPLTYDSFGACFWVWCSSCFIQLCLLPLSVLSLRRNNKELRYRIKSLVR